VPSGLERLTCIYGRPRTGTTSITGELNKSSRYCIWVEKDIWTTRAYSTSDELLAAAAAPGGTSPMARRYNEDVPAHKEGYAVLGDKTTWMAPPGQADGFEQVLENLRKSASSLSLGHEIVVCLRDARSWLAAWAMTHYLRRREADESFWGSMTSDPDVRSLLAREMESYRSHLQAVLARSDDPSVRIRCLERTDRDEFRYLFDFGDYIEWASPPSCREGVWPARLKKIKQELEDRIRSGWLGICTSEELYRQALDLHRSFPITQPDGSVREV
jgi:hypothetical protein